MIPGEFIIDGVSSLDYNTFIQDRPLIEAPVRNSDKYESGSRDGVSRIVRDTYKESPLELILYTKAEEGVRASDVRPTLYNLFDKRGFVELIFYFDPDIIYRASLDEEAVQFESKYYYEEGQSWKVNLKIHPWKILVDSPTIQLSSQPHRVYNPTYNASLPRITIDTMSGSGSITITHKNSGEKKSFNLKDVTIKSGSKLILDSEVSMTYSVDKYGNMENENAFAITKDYLYFKPGESEITWTGLSGITMEPRWRVLV